MPRVKIIVEYDGSNFQGWQSQPGMRTVQQELEKSLNIIVPIGHKERANAFITERATQVLDYYGR